jgi:hypothetical protein
MQIFTDTNIHYYELFGQVISIILSIWRILKSIANSLETKLNEIITTNVNRISLDLQNALAKALAGHETNAFAKLDKQNQEMDRMLEVLKDINNKLGNNLIKQSE